MTDARQEVIATFRKSEKEMENALWNLRNVLTGTPYLVRCDRVCLTFQVSDDGIVTDPRPAGPHLAMRFSRRDAEQVAAQVVNGAGIQAEAVLVIEAIESDLASVRELLAKIDE